MSSYRVDLCGLNTSKLPLLSDDEKKNLFIKAANGDRKAREELIFCNLRLVLSIIHKFSGKSEDIDDLFQIGCIGLIKAIDNFDISQEVKFSTYAVPMITGEVKRYLRDNSSIRVSRSLKDVAYKAIYTREKLIKQGLAEPAMSEIAEEIGVDISDVVIALEAVQSPVSLYDPVYNDNSGDTLFLMDQISDKKNVEENWIENISLREATRALPEREKEIIRMRFYDGRTQMEVAKELGISQAQVSRLEKSALNTMRDYLI